MPLSAAEKQRHYRERKKAQLGEAVVREADAARKRLERKLNPEAVREHARLQMAQYRARLKMLADPKPDLPAYSRISSQTCAKRRVE